MEKSANPFRINLKSSLLSRLLERVIGLRPYIEFYEKKPQNASSSEFLDYALGELDLTIDKLSCDAIATIPKTGGLLIVCNHPFGGVEGIAITREILKYRSDIKVLTNQLLTKIPEFSELFIGVDVLSEQKSRQNIQGIRQANAHLSSGGVLLLFPAGKVAALDIKSRKVTELPWNNMVGSLIKRHNVDCLPMFISGKNSVWFYLLGLIHPRLRTARLAREVTNKRSKSLKINVGSLIKSSAINHFSSSRDITAYVRLTTDLLGRNDANDAASASLSAFSNCSPIDLTSTNATASQYIQRFTKYHLISHRSFQVYCVPYSELGDFMTLIGKAREHTFRVVGEGTGKEVDSDQFDPYYSHLIAWDAEKEQIIGGYRIGFVDKIIQAHGINALYTRSLYKYQPSFLKNLGNCLELGRSFITPEYQRHPAALDVLWKGIGAVVAKHPNYHTLFGAVSVSSEYSELARAFISETMLTSFRAEQIYIDQVSPKIPLKVKGRVWTHDVLMSINKISIINQLIGCVDPGKGIPILLRQYIALNGKFVTFTVNKGFNDALDGMVLLNLHDTPPKYLKRYLSQEGYETFQEYWQKHQKPKIIELDEVASDSAAEDIKAH